MNSWFDSLGRIPDYNYRHTQTAVKQTDELLNLDQLMFSTRMDI